MKNNQKPFYFEILYQSTKSRARVGKIHTPHGIIDTPGFVPVGTNASVKSITTQQLDQCETQLIFCNTYHLMLHPGTETIAKAGGLHTFINRNKPIITDSGGFQVFSLMYGSVNSELKSKGKKQQKSGVLKINEDGVLFRSYRDGSPLLLTPEISIQAQKQLGADIIIPFDELPPYHTTLKKLHDSLDRTHRWELRSLFEHKNNPQNQAIYGVIHGGIDQQLRSKSCNYLSSLDFNGFAIGGSIGKNHQEMFSLLDYIMPQIPYEKPTHLLGIGDIAAFEKSICNGVDTFDSSHPTKCARHGLLFTMNTLIKITQSCYKNRFTPIEINCDCFTCKNHTLAYLHHLVKSHELTFYTLATIHNIRFMMRLMEDYRTKIYNGIL